MHAGQLDALEMRKKSCGSEVWLAGNVGRNFGDKVVYVLFNALVMHVLCRLIMEAQRLVVSRMASKKRLLDTFEGASQVDRVAKGTKVHGMIEGLVSTRLTA